jgi:hypothetical protein
VPRCYKEDNWSKNLKTEIVARESPPGDELRAEAEETALLEAVTRERLGKTQQTEKTVCCSDL